MAKVSDLEFLGAGMVAPFRINARGDIDNAGGLRNVQSAVYTLLSTRPGELPWKPSFGTDLRPLQHSNNDALLEDEARSIITQAFRKWESRVEIVRVTANRVPEKGQLMIDVQYRILGGVVVEGETIFSTEVVILE